MGIRGATGDAVLRARSFFPNDTFIQRERWTVVQQRPGQLLRSDWAHAVAGFASFSVAWNALPVDAVQRCVKFECEMADSIAAATEAAALTCWAKGGTHALLSPHAATRPFSTSLFLNRAILRFFHAGDARFSELNKAMAMLAVYNAGCACSLPLCDFGKVVGFTDAFSCDICTFAGCSYMVADGARLVEEPAEEEDPRVMLLCGRCYRPRAAQLATWERVNTGTSTLSLFECAAVRDNVYGAV
jgi:hypothetical protein